MRNTYRLAAVTAALFTATVGTVGVASAAPTTMPSSANCVATVIHSFPKPAGQLVSLIAHEAPGTVGQGVGNAASTDNCSQIQVTQAP